MRVLDINSQTLADIMYRHASPRGGTDGNHDLFHTGWKALSQRKHVHLLDGEVVELGELVVGGVGGISGNPDRHGRRSLEVQIERVREVAAQKPDVLVLHEGPRGTGRKQRGNEDLSDALEGYEGIVLCGHTEWPDALSGQTLNVHGRAVVFRATAGAEGVE